MLLSKGIRLCNAVSPIFDKLISNLQNLQIFLWNKPHNSFHEFGIRKPGLMRKYVSFGFFLSYVNGKN